MKLFVLLVLAATCAHAERKATAADVAALELRVKAAEAEDVKDRERTRLSRDDHRKLLIKAGYSDVQLFLEE